MLCMECGANANKGYTTDVTDLGNCLVIVRNVPCYKCQSLDIMMERRKNPVVLNLSKSRRGAEPTHIFSTTST